MPDSACDTGQPAFAPSAISANFSASRPGTVALTLRWLPVMPVPGTNVTEAVASMLSGGVPFCASAFDSAMLKHDECAAAISSSGVVVLSEPSLRAFQFTGNVPIPDPGATLPDPSNRDPFQVVVASLVTLMWLLLDGTCGFIASLVTRRASRQGRDAVRAAVTVRLGLPPARRSWEHRIVSPQVAALVLAGIVLVAVLAGLVVRALQGRARRLTGSGPAAAALGLGDGELGERATLVQFSTELCAKCPATRRLLGEVSGAAPGVRHVDIDLTHRPDLARRFAVLQTPTVLVLDAGGMARARVAGAPMRETVLAELDRIGGIHV